MCVDGRTGFGVVGGEIELVVDLIDKTCVGDGITTGAEADVVGLVGAEDVVTATELEMNAGVEMDVPLGMLLCAIDS